MKTSKKILKQKSKQQNVMSFVNIQVSAFENTICSFFLKLISK